MQTIYQASNGVEAHMLKNMLEQEDIPAFIEGEYLQGGVGDLPAHNLVRLLVVESDFVKAKSIIDAWTQLQEANPAETELKPRQQGNTVGLLFLGLVSGVVITSIFFRAPYSSAGTDHNYDGRLDDQWTYNAIGLPLLNEVDRNLDNKFDMITHFDKNGLMEYSEYDDNFDGVFETRATFEKGNISSAKTDTDGDGFPDFITNYKFGVVSSVEYINVYSGYPKKICYFELGKLKSCDIDTNLDRVMDKHVRYDENGDIETK
ncbi:DUF2007 domain-containing protein [Undibacterium sp. Di24W]|uniref:putative signal transducing protein n=1 Tax=Undibacterium sp. Di24W TaxID=3413033 RepID=UPI003BF2C78D